jgi:hypothetical protein
MGTLREDDIKPTGIEGFVLSKMPLKCKFIVDDLGKQIFMPCACVGVGTDQIVLMGIKFNELKNHSSKSDLNDIFQERI